MRIWVIIFSFTMALLMPSSSQAEVSDCTTAAFSQNLVALQLIGDGFPSEISCDPRTDVSFVDRAGVHVIRIMDDRYSPSSQALIDQVTEGARAAIATFDDIGPFVIGDIQILLYDGAISDRVKDKSTLAATNQAEGSTECFIVFYKLQTGAPHFVMSPRSSIAHEIFHCIQNANLSAEQRTGETIFWWLEGSAEAFSDLAFPHDNQASHRTTDFYSLVQVETALYKMDYAAAVFFYWYIQQFGSQSMLPFLRDMAGGGVEEQKAAMRARMTEDQWLNFAKAYADHQIVSASGQIIGAEPEPHILFLIDEGAKSISVKPFTITFGKANYPCGIWENEPPDYAPFATKYRSQDWQDWPLSFDASREANAELRFVAIPTTDIPSGVDILVTRKTGECNKCVEVSEHDACLMGTWLQTGGGPIEFMRSHGVTLNMEADSPSIMINPDGSFIQGIAMIDVRNGPELSRNEALIVGQARGETFGNWASQNGKLFICPLAHDRAGTVSIDDRTSPIPPAMFHMSNIVVTYECSGNDFSTIMKIPGLGDMKTNYTRVD